MWELSFQTKHNYIKSLELFINFSFLNHYLLNLFLLTFCACFTFKFAFLVVKKEYQLIYEIRYYKINVKETCFKKSFQIKKDELFVRNEESK